MDKSARNRFQILPSLLSADFARLGEQIKEVESAGCEIVHLDIMDGHFVPNLTFGPPLVRSLAEQTDLSFDVHLMVTDPDRWTEAFDVPNTCCITIHAEAGPHTQRSLQKIKDQGKMAGLAFNPATPVDILEYLWPSLDLVLIMTVNPGFGGQSFIEACREKISKVAGMIEKRREDHPESERVVLEIDGGVSQENLEELSGLGAQWIVTGNSLFGGKDLANRFLDFQRAGSESWNGRIA